MKGRAAIVTGAASGIGRAIAADLAAAGARVLFADVNLQEGERVAADFSTGAFQHADIARQADCDALVARAVRDFGGVDILVNNAGYSTSQRSRSSRSRRGSVSSASCCSAPSDAVVRDIMLAPAALKRLLEPSEVAAYVRFLCSDEASGITGATQVIDAGWTAR